MKKIIWLLVVSVVLLIIGWLSYSGLFAKVTISESDEPGFFMVYEKHVGSYKNTAPVMDKIYEDLLANGITSTQGVGLYYDKPGDVEESKLRSVVGCILNNTADAQKIKGLGSKFKIVEIPASHYVKSTFPYSNTISIVIGIFKVYPEFSKYMKEKNYSGSPSFEIYDEQNKKIIYLMSLADNKALYESLLK